MQFRLVQMVNWIFSQPLADLGTTVVDAVWAPDEGDQRILARRFFENHFRMAGSDNLTTILLCQLAQQIIGLPLSHDLEMGVRLVEKKSCLRIRQHIGQQKENLLLTSSG